MQKPLTNYAFIDCQNVYLNVRKLGWILDWKKFRRYLREKHAVKVAYIFIGYIEQNQSLYDLMRCCGYSLVFKEVVHQEGKPKGNVDAELVLQTMIEYDRYDQAVIVSSDGDFACLVRYLDSKAKFRRVISPNRASCSHLLNKSCGSRIDYIEDLKRRLEYERA